MDLREFRVVVRIVDRVAKRALFAEEQMVALEGQCAEWKRIADELKAERDAERKAHDEYKERNRELFHRNQSLTAELAVIKDERDALRSTTIDTAAGSLLDAFGFLANEPRNGAPDAEYRDRIVRKIHAIKLERDALKKERDDLWQREGIEQKRRIDVEQERDALRAQLETERKPNPVNVPRAHPVKVGEYVKNDNGDVCQVHEVYAEYLLNTGWTWAFENCTPCDPPTASVEVVKGGDK